MKILIVEDEVKLANFVFRGLKDLGQVVNLAYNQAEAKNYIADQKYDVVIMDYMLPDGDGLELLKWCKELHPKTSVIMLTALSSTNDKVRCLDAGADDYLTKPFEFEELYARIKALARRNLSDRKEIRIADLVLNMDTRIVKRGDKKINLTAKEFALLEYLLCNQGIPQTRNQIAEKVWNVHFDQESNIVDVYINHLRKKIDSDFELKLIRTRIGHGYVLSDEKD